MGSCSIKKKVFLRRNMFFRQKLAMYAVNLGLWGPKDAKWPKKGQNGFFYHILGYVRYLYVTPPNSGTGAHIFHRTLPEPGGATIFRPLFYRFPGKCV